MIRNYFLLAIKNLRKQKLFSVLNIAGLTVGITCCFLIYIFILNEFSFDNFHRNGKDIYRVMRVGELNGDRREIPYVSIPYGPALMNDFPSYIRQQVRVMQDNELFSMGTTSFNEKQVILTDSNFFNFFDFHLLKGNPATVLSSPNSVVLSASTAKKYFGKDDPLGKTIELNKQQQLQVTGIMEDVPVNSHLQFNAVLPLEIMRQYAPGLFDQWPNNSLYTYVQLAPGVKREQLEKQFDGFMDKYMGAYYAQSGHKMGLMIKPLKDIYFSVDRFDNVKHGNEKMVYVFMSVALLLLLIACINFINLATARATDRSKEVGVRKVLGALKGQLLGQFIFESLLFATLACVLSMILVWLLMPAYNALLGYTLPAIWDHNTTYLFLGGVIIVVGVLAGSYPAFLLSSFSPIESLKGKLKTGKQGNLFRKGLVVFQFGMSVLLVICVFVITGQMNYIRNTDLGFDKTQYMIVRMDNTDISRDRTRFKSALLTIPAVKQVSLMSGEPGGFHDGYSFEVRDRPGQTYQFNTEFTDLDFISTLGVKIIAGRAFSPSYPTDTLQAAIINRQAAIALGFSPEEAIGKSIRNISRDSLPRTIVGVVEDYHYASLRDPIGKLVITPGRDHRLALIRIQTANLPAAVNDIKKAYTAVAPAYPFEYTFLDKVFDKLYRSETNQEKVLGLFSMIAIFIACLGLFGLASYAVVKRTKEIGIRKVIGSSVQNIVMLLSGDLLKPVLVGTLIAMPLAYYAMHKWLQGFAYRIQIQWWMFVSAALLALLIAFVTIGFQALKAALANPVKSLRTE